jgi:hypothetical protein
MDPAPNSTIIHPTWHKYLNTDDIPDHIPLSYATLTNTPSTIHNTLKRARPPIPQDIPDPQHTTDNPLDTMEIDGHKHLLHHTFYHVNKWRPERLTAKQFCHHRMGGLTTAHLTRDNPEDEDAPILSITFNITWNPTRVSEAMVLTTPNGKSTIDKYITTKAPTRKKVRASPPASPEQPEGWHPRHTTFTTKPINQDLDAIPTGAFEITYHSTNNHEILLHAPDGRLIPPWQRHASENSTTFTPTQSTKPPSQRHWQTSPTNTLPSKSHTIQPRKRSFTNPTNSNTTMKLGTWPIPDILYDALHRCFDIKRDIHCNPINLPLRAKTYISHDPKDTRFGATPYTHTA